MKTTRIEKLTIASIAIVIAGMLIPLAGKLVGGDGWEFSEGQRTGIPYKLSKKGMLYKTWEGELSLQMMTQDANGRMVNEVFRYSVSNDSVAEKINEAAITGKPVTLTYKQYMLRSMKHGSTSYDVIAVTK